MKLLWKDFSQRMVELRKKGKWLLGLDYDGTLSPIASKPGQAKLQSETRLLLKRIARSKRVVLCFVTGRSLNGIFKIVRIKRAIYIANHGFQILIENKTWVHPKAVRIRKSLSESLQILEKELKSVPGILIEDKVQTISCHFRNVPKRFLKDICLTIRNVVNKYSKDLRLFYGKKVYEIRPNVDWNKGEALAKVVLDLKGFRKPAIIYFGDDVTDEDVFRILKTTDLSVRVGLKRLSNASYYVRNVHEVTKFLKLFEKILL